MADHNHKLPAAMVDDRLTNILKIIDESIGANGQGPFPVQVIWGKPNWEKGTNREFVFSATLLAALKPFM